MLRLVYLLFGKVEDHPKNSQFDKLDFLHIFEYLP